MQTCREQLLKLAADLGIDDEEGGETDWAYYLNNQQLADAIIELRPDDRAAVEAIAIGN